MIAEGWLVQWLNRPRHARVPGVAEEAAKMLAQALSTPNAAGPTANRFRGRKKGRFGPFGGGTAVV
jgi:hypothetical protein